MLKCLLFFHLVEINIALSRLALCITNLKNQKFVTNSKLCKKRQILWKVQKLQKAKTDLQKRQNFGKKTQNFAGKFFCRVYNYKKEGYLIWTLMKTYWSSYMKKKCPRIYKIIACGLQTATAFVFIYSCVGFFLISCRTSVFENDQINQKFCHQSKKSDCNAR